MTGRPQPPDDDRLDEVARRVEECVAILERESGIRPHHVTDQGNRDLAEPYYGEEEGRLFLRAQERGTLVHEEFHDDVESLVESIMRCHAGAAARTYEVHHRREGEDSRRQWFHLEELWLGAMDPAWGERQRQDNAETLRSAPFDDDARYRAEAAVYGLAEEMDMRRRIRDRMAAAEPSSDPVSTQGPTPESPSDHSEWRPWLIAAGAGFALCGALRMIEAVVEGLP